MRELQILLRRFLAREISIDELQSEFALLLRGDPDLAGKAAAWLDAGEKDGLLSAAVCTALKSVLISHMASTSAGPSPGDSGIFDRLVMDADGPAAASSEPEAEPKNDSEAPVEASETFIRDPGATEIGTVPPETPPSADDGVLRIGSIVGGRYELMSQLGSGGMGRVYMARDRLRAEAQDRDPHVALKVLSEEFKQHPDSMIALQREVRRAQTLAHPNVITVHEFFRDGSNVYMTMELLKGNALDQLIQSNFANGTSYEQAWPIIEGVCHALQYGHDKGIVHSDIKPGNIFVCDDGSVKVLDLGISRPMTPTNVPNAEETVFDPGKRLGSLTPAYAALEMWYQDTPDPRDDIYALACVSYVLLTGVHPFDGASARDAKEQNLVPAKIDSVARGQWQALLRGLKFDRADRTLTVNKFRREMEPQAVVRRNRRYAALGTVAAVIVAGAIGMQYYTAAVEEAAMDDRGRMGTTGGPQAEGVVRTARPELTPEQTSEIESLLSLAAIQFELLGESSSAEELAYVLSQGPNNVVQLVDTVLQIDPGYEGAIETRQRVFDLYVERARQFESAEEYEQALLLTQNAEEVIHNSSAVLRMQRRICNSAPSACAAQ